MNAPRFEIQATVCLVLLVAALGTAAPARQNSASTKSSQSGRRPWARERRRVFTPPGGKFRTAKETE